MFYLFVYLIKTVLKCILSIVVITFTKYLLSYCMLGQQGSKTAWCVPYTNIGHVSSGLV